MIPLREYILLGLKTRMNARPVFLPKKLNRELVFFVIFSKYILKLILNKTLIPAQLDRQALEFPHQYIG